MRNIIFILSFFLSLPVLANDPLQEMTPQDLQHLIDGGYKVNVLNFEGESPFHRATTLGLTELVKVMVRAGAKTSQPNEKGNTPVHLALLSKNLEMLKLLLHYDVDLLWLNDDLLTPLALAARLDDSAAVKEIVFAILRRSLFKANGDSNSEYLESALKLLDLPTPIVFGKAPAEFGIWPGHDFNREDVALNLVDAALEDQNAIADSVQNCSEKILRERFRNGGINQRFIEFRRRTPDGHTPLHLFAQYNRPRLVQLMLVYGAEETVRDKRGQTPMRLAIEKSSYDSALVLFLNTIAEHMWGSYGFRSQKEMRKLHKHLKALLR